MKRLVPGLIALAVLGGGAARAEMSGFMDPALRDSKYFDSVVIFVYGATLEERRTIEGAVVERFRSHEVRALRGVDVEPRPGDCSGEEWAKRVVESGVGALLLIGVGGEGAAETSVPNTLHPINTYGRYATSYGDTTYLNMYKDLGCWAGGYIIDRPASAYTASLINLRDGSLGVWKADSTLPPGAFQTFGELSRSIAQEAVGRLLADGLF